jgi:ribosomal peptide maturation radical SAM protein 1
MSGASRAERLGALQEAIGRDTRLEKRLFAAPAEALRGAEVLGSDEKRRLAEALDSASRTPTYWPEVALTREWGHNPFAYLTPGTSRGAVDPFRDGTPGRDGVELAEVVIVVPPWAELNWPSLSAHILQAVGVQEGIEVAVLYANLYFGARVGQGAYEVIAYGPRGALLGEGLFSARAFGLPPLIERGGKALAAELARLEVPLGEAQLTEYESIATGWVDDVAELIASARPRLVGATTGFEQTSASIAILDAVKARTPDVTTIIGGPNCEGEMAEGVASLPSHVDHVFSGEAEVTFREFLRSWRQGNARSWPRVIRGSGPASMDAVPTPVYSHYYQQRAKWLPVTPGKERNVWLSYETSRGCWWGAKHHCKFCGLNGRGMALRAKSPSRVLAELKELVSRHPSTSVWMTDNIMPFAYFRALLPRLASELPGLRIYWELKANLSLDKVSTLKAAGLGCMQPGVESLSTPLLKRMDKGVSAAQNVALLRYNRALGVPDTWNILYGFPGDGREDYETQIALIPRLHHLHPPAFLTSVSLDRFSPYYDDAEHYGVRAVRPRQAYYWTFPSAADIRSLAYHFVGDYRSVITEAPELVNELERAYVGWRDAWDTGQGKPPPALSVAELSSNVYSLIDTRPGVRQPRISFIDERQAREALAGRTRAGSPRSTAKWALEREVVVEVDNEYVPVATAEPALLHRCETGSDRRRDVD